MHRLLPLLLLAACEPSEEEQADLGRDLSQDYAKAACRLYTEEACVQNQSDTCGVALSFETMADCRDFFTFLFLTCADDVYAALWENEDLVADCVAELGAFDCTSDEICTEDGGIWVSGACGELDDVLEGYCDSGDTGA